VVRRILIPDKLCSKALKKAQAKGCPAEELILRAIKASLLTGEAKPEKRNPPIIHSKRPGTLYLDNAQIFELIEFP
jgi:hypothetical protein